MIRINLIGAGGGGTAGRSTGRRGGAADLAATGVAVLALGAAVALVASGARSLHQTAAAVTRALAAADAGRQAHAGAVERAAAGERRREALARRVAQLTRWRATRAAPARLLETVSRSVPDGIWLVGVQQDAEAIVLTGRSTRSEAVFEFASNLEASGRVVLPVEIVGTDGGAEGRFALRVALPRATDTADRSAPEE